MSEESKNKEDKTNFDLKKEVKEGSESVKEAFKDAGNVAGEALNKADKKVKEQDPKTLATASFILGIVSLVCIPTGYGGLVGIATGIIGLVLGIKANKALPKKSNYASAGIIMSIIGLSLSALAFAACTACVGPAGCSAFNAGLF